jgi:hypothetical protein
MTSDVNEITAHAYSDTYAILGPNGDCVGCEHNQTEANALAAWLDNQRGGGYTVRRNTPDQVRAAKAWFPQPVRHSCREDAFRDLAIF